MFYDFNSPEEVPADHKGAFDVVIIDPPFITHEVCISCLILCNQS